MAYRILLIEDEPQICEMICDYFSVQSEGNCPIDCFHNGADGLEAALSGEYDLILLDVMLPSLDGFSVCRSIRAKSDVPLLFLTARAREEDLLYGYTLGCDDYIIKPFSLAALYAKTQALLKRAKGTVLHRELVCGAITLNPVTLAVIYGFAENLRQHTHPDKADDYADGIMENAAHIDEMIAGVLGLAQLEQNAAPEMKETVDVTALLHEAFARNAAEMQLRGLNVQESGKWEIRGNAEMLRQMAENLAVNVVQHAAENSTVSVTAEGKTLSIRNAYTGELDAKTLCEPFRRGDAARGKGAGSGLGLSFVQQIAVLYKLRLKITAENGLFTVQLRRRGAANKNRKPASAS